MADHVTAFWLPDLGEGTSFFRMTEGVTEIRISTSKVASTPSTDIEHNGYHLATDRLR